MIRDSRLHGRRDPERLVDTGEVVVHKVQATAALWLSSFFEKALVRRVNLRICILTVRFCRST